MNLWHDIDDKRISANDFLGVIEISKDSKNKYELDKDTGMLILDRVLSTAMRYPANYGFIPKTLGEDNDPLDVLVIASENIIPSTLVRVYPIGAIRMIDDGEGDDKILAIPYKDPQLNHIKDVSQLSKHMQEEFMHFFKTYKALENKETSDIGMLSLKEATAIIEKSIKSYKAKFKK